VAKHDLIELVRTSKDRKPVVDALLTADDPKAAILLPISMGRTALEAEVVKQAVPKLKDFGIELIDVRFMRINYNARVSAKIHERMISERQQIASRFRSEGEGEAAKITGNKERDLKRIDSEAYREVQKIRGEADAKASEIYARAYGGSPEAGEFYRFLRTMETYQKTLSHDTTLIFTTDSDLFRYLKRTQPTNVSGALPKP
jgi:membrane protease subunit HflC